MSDLPLLLAWLDFETTGVGSDCELLEVAVIVTDSNMRPLAEFETTINPLPPGHDISLIIMQCDPVVQQMHSDNGLWQEVQSFGATKESAEFGVIEAIRKAAQRMNLDNPTLGAKPTDYVVKIAGSGVEGFDRPLLPYHMPMLDNTVHYRTVDVSSMRNFVNDLAPEAMTPALAEHLAKEVPHRSMGDVKHHMETARLLRSMITWKA